MTIAVEDIETLMGDRVLVEVLDRPEKIGGFFIPESHNKEQKGQNKIFWGRIVKFGLDSKAEGKTSDDDEGFLKEGDIVGVEPFARDCAGFTGSDGKEYRWIPDEFVAAKDEGTMRAYYGL